MHPFLDLSHYFPEDSIRAGFSLRPFPFTPPEDRIELAKEFGLNPDSIVIPNQVHSGKVQIVQEPRFHPSTDGLVTDDPCNVLTIQVADCVPIFIADISKKIIGLIHAGWRGVTSNIIEHCLDKLYSLGAERDNLHVVLGPCIHECCFEVGPEVTEHFPIQFVKSGKSDRSYVNLTGVIKEKMMMEKIPSKHIHIVDECTCCLPEKYHSYRRDGDRSGRMIAILGIADD